MVSIVFESGTASVPTPDVGYRPGSNKTPDGFVGKVPSCRLRVLVH